MGMEEENETGPSQEREEEGEAELIRGVLTAQLLTLSELLKKLKFISVLYEWKKNSITKLSVVIYSRVSQGFVASDHSPKISKGNNFY